MVEERGRGVGEKPLAGLLSRQALRQRVRGVMLPNECFETTRAPRL